MKKSIIVSAVCLIIVACTIVYLKTRVDREWKSGLYIPETQLEVAVGEDNQEIDLEIVAVGDKYKKIVSEGSYSLYIYSSEAVHEVNTTLLYSIDSSKYSQYIIHIDLKNVDVGYISGLKISCENRVLVEKPVKISLVKNQNRISDVRIGTSTATLLKNGFENVYYIINRSEEPVTLSGIEWLSLSDRNTVVTYVNDVGIDDEHVDMIDAEFFKDSPIIISPGKEAIITVKYDDSAFEGTFLWGTPSFIIDNTKIAPNSAGFLSIPNMSVEDALTLIQGGQKSDQD